MRTRRHFVEHRAEGEQVGACVQFFAASLLRRHVGDRADACPGLVSCSCADSGWHRGNRRRLRLSGVTFASPKSRILACPRSVTKMLAGLMSRWTMPLACAASSASAISMAKSSTASISSGVPAMRCFSVTPSRNSMAMKASPSLLADFVDRADVRMIQGGGGLRFALEAAREPAGLWQISSGRNFRATKRCSLTSSAL